MRTINPKLFIIAHMKKLISIVVTLALAIPVFAQSSIPAILEITSTEVDGQEIEVFQMVKDGVKAYYLDAGTLGAGSHIIQINFDPLFHLFIPLGDTLDGAIEKLEQIRAVARGSVGDVLEIPGCLAPAFPNNDLETVTIAKKRFILIPKIEFSVQRDGYVRATYFTRSQLAGLVSGIKFYKKLHPNEK